MVLRDEQEATVFAVTIQTEKLEQISILQTPYIFDDKQPDNENLYPVQGIRKYGPYDINTSDRQTLRKFRGVEFFVFYPKDEDIIFKNLKRLMSMLRDGYFERRGQNDISFNSFKSEFKLKEAFVPEADEFIPYKPGNLQQELKLRKINFDEVFERENCPIAIIGGSSHRSILKNRDQYLEAKREFTNLNSPCQYASFYEYETGGAGILYDIGRSDRPFGYSLWNFALNIYGKIGGLAWVVRQKLSETSTQSIDLTIGLRFVRSKREKGFTIGYATILDRFGKLIGVVSSPLFKADIERTLGMVVPTQIMETIIREALKKSVGDPRVKEILQEKGTLNIAFHRLSLFHSQEILGITSAINKEFSSLKIKYGLISIVNTPSVLVFNKDDKYCNTLRGTAIALNNRTAVLYTTGASRPTDKRAISYPITVIVQNLEREECPFKTLEEACNHVFSLTNLHWQTVIAGSVRLPATLEFAQNIAQLSSFGIKPKEDSWLWRTLWFI